MDNTELVSKFMKIGFTENESKAYIGLVNLSEANARELHEYTGIPRAKIYEVLTGLVEKGYAEIRHGSPTCYQPAEPDELITKLKKEYLEIFKSISESLEEMHYEKEESSPIWYLKSEWPILKRGKKMIEDTDKNLLVISKNPQYLLLFKDEIKKLAARAEVMIFADEIKSYEDLGANVYKKELDYQKLFKPYYEGSTDKNRVMIIADGKTALIIENKAGKMEGVFMTHSLVEVVYHSIMFMHDNMEEVTDEGETIKISIRKPKSKNSDEIGDEKDDKILINKKKI